MKFELVAEVENRTTLLRQEPLELQLVDRTLRDARGEKSAWELRYRRKTVLSSQKDMKVV